MRIKANERGTKANYRQVCAEAETPRLAQRQAAKEPAEIRLIDEGPEEKLTPFGVAEAVDSPTGDHALGLCLKQMGAIPMLNRKQELALAQRLEISRKRYRRAVLFNGSVLAQVMDTFERIQAG